MNRISQLRKEKRLSQTSLALRLNTTQYMISSYETERHQPSIEMLILLADFFNVSVDYLINHSDVRSSRYADLEAVITDDEKRLLNYYSCLNNEQKEIALGVLFALKGYKKEI